MKKIKNKAENDENSIPLHRSYGVRKRETLVTRFNNILAVGIAVLTYLMLAAVWLLGVVILTALLGSIGIMLICIFAVLFVYFVPCRRLRKRLRFVLRLKRLCRKNGYVLTFERGFFKGLKINKEGFDFTVDTGTLFWAVRFYTPRKYLSHLTFIDRNTVEVKTNITKSHFKYIVGLLGERVRREQYSFDDAPTCRGRRTMKALILNPVPHEAFKKDADGATVPIGSGEHLYDYTLFSGTGFLNIIAKADA